MITNIIALIARIIIIAILAIGFIITIKQESVEESKDTMKSILIFCVLLGLSWLV